MGYVDGSIPAPASTITTAATETTAAASAPNPEYVKWFKTDQKLVSILSSSITESVARHTIGYETSKEIWDCITNHFAQKSEASATSLKLQLFDLKKGSQTVDAYFQQAKSIADSLASINQSVSDTDLVVATLHGLGPDYMMLRTALSTQKLPNFSELRGRILAFDAQQPSSPDVGTASALFNQAPSNRQFSTGKSSKSKKSSFHSSSRNNYWRPRQNTMQYQQPPFPYAQQPQQPLFSSPAWASRPGSNGILGPVPIWCPNCQSNQHGLNQCPHRFSGPSTAAPFAGAHFAADPNWYPDTGATHHMTAMPVQNPQLYSGPHNVYMGNGDSMPVSHTGNLPLSLGSSHFTLYDVFRIPSIRKNLLSVARFTKDNLVFFLFAPDFYQIYCLRTGRLLFQGPCKDGLYPLNFSAISSTPQALASIHSTVWHNRLGHPSSHVLSRLSPEIGSKLSFNSFCHECALSKSHQLSFPSNKETACTAFSIIHSDVWQSPTVSVTGFKYYVLFTDEYSRYTWIYPMRRKSEVFTHFQTLVAMIKNIFNNTIKYLQSDNGTEYTNNAFSHYCKTLGIQQRFSCPHTPQQNGLAERKHRHIATMIRSLPSHLRRPSKYLGRSRLNRCLSH